MSLESLKETLDWWDENHWRDIRAPDRKVLIEEIVEAARKHVSCSDRPPLLWVAGGRNNRQVEVVRSELVSYHGWTLITGSGRGTDLIAERLWREMQRPYVGIPARWSAHGRGAGPNRNRVIAEQWRPKRLLAFPGGPGTADAIDRARSLGIEVVEVAEHIKEGR